MLTESTNSLTYQKLSKEEMESRGILGRLVGVCADFITPTRNGRKYPEKLWENVFNDEIMKERIANGVCFGELGHPPDREETDMEKVCICMPEEPKKGPDGKLRAVFDILDTPNGRILKSLCDYGSTLGISSRGSGDLETDFNGNESVNPDTYNCEGFDVVLLPGVKDARLQYVNESLDSKGSTTLREMLTESINKETKDHQKTIMESLGTLGIKLNEDAYTEDELLDKFGTTDLDIINAGNEETVTLKESGNSEYHQLDMSFENSVSFDDKDKASGRIRDIIDYLETHNQEYAIYDDKTDNGCTIFYEGDLGITEDLAINRETDDNIDEVQKADDNDMAIVNELQEALKLNKKLDEKIVNLQEKLSACYAKEMKLEESIDNYKVRIAKLSNTSKENKALTEKVSKLERDLLESNDKLKTNKHTLNETLQRDAKDRKSLQESLESKDQELAELTKRMEDMKKVITANEEQFDDMSEQLETVRKDNKQLKETYSRRLEENNKLIEKYKTIAKRAVDKYIDKQATILGVTDKEIKNRLPESYTFKDIDSTCESLREYKVNMNSLPFNTTKVNESINVSAKNVDKRTLVRDADDELSDADLKLAEKFIR